VPCFREETKKRKDTTRKGKTRKDRVVREMKRTEENIKKDET
jgi:hypothetical protein